MTFQMKLYRCNSTCAQRVHCEMLRNLQPQLPLWCRDECSQYHSPAAGACWHRSVVQTTVAWYIFMANHS